MVNSENTIHSLWLGNRLSDLELLTIRSFQQHGHDIQLWLYENDVEYLPSDVTIRDANEVIPKEKVFKYPENGKIDWGKGSYGGFSDIFRYKLLYDHGGWWVDTDVTCLKPFDFEEPYFFRNHWKLPVVGNIMKSPKGSELMKACYQQASDEVDETNTDWHRPIEILNENIERLGLMKYRRLGLFNLDLAHHLDFFMEGNYPIPHDWYGIHWVNSAGRKGYRTGSTYEQLLQKYGVLNDFPAEAVKPREEAGILHKVFKKLRG